MMHFDKPEWASDSAASTELLLSVTPAEHSPAGHSWLRWAERVGELRGRSGGDHRCYSDMNPA